MTTTSTEQMTLPQRTRERATFRVQYMQSAGSFVDQQWTTLPIPRIICRTDNSTMSGTVEQGGYHVKTITRVCLPEEDSASFYIDYGTINGTVVTPLDLAQSPIRIQVYDDENFPGVATSFDSSKWKTVFCGYVAHVSRDTMPGQRPTGRATYTCFGILWRMRSWPLDRHSAYKQKYQKSNPGYNIPLHGWFRKVLGNRDTTTTYDPYGDLNGAMGDFRSYFYNHALPVSGKDVTITTWTDTQVVQHAMVSSRAAGEPLVEVDFSSGLFGGVYAWEISAEETCRDLLVRVCNRQRGRGAVFFDYEDTGEITKIKLKSRKTNVADIVYNTTTVAGDLTLNKVNRLFAAVRGVDVIDVNLYGDHRLTSDGFSYEDRATAVYDALVVQGERIQVCANLNFFSGSLSKRWSQKDQDDFKALTNFTERISPRWRHVWRRYGFGDPAAQNANLTFDTKPEPDDTAVSLDYWTDYDGKIEINQKNNGNLNDYVESSSYVTLRFLPDLPIYEGWKYSVDPAVRYDDGADYMPPSRMPAQVLMRADSDYTSGQTTLPTWVPLNYAGFNIQVDDFGFYIVGPGEDSAGVRLLANTDDAGDGYSAPDIPGVTTAGGIDLQKLNTIVGLELGSRVSVTKRRISDDYWNLGKRMVMTINGIHLWLGPGGGIFECDWQRGAVENYKPGLKFPKTQDKPIYVIRDDRNALSQIAALAWEYYGKVHNPGKWTLKDCGLLTYFALETDVIQYPTIGQLVSTVVIGPSDKVTLNTPITLIHYDHDAMETTWRTDFIQHDGNIQ